MANEDDFKPIEDMLAHANPNPERVGCPSPDVLRELALRKRDAADPQYVHVSQCSPCYNEIREMQRQLGAEVRTRKFSPFWVAAVALLLVAIGVAWYVRLRPMSPSVASVTQPGVKLPATILDLRPFAVTRSEDPSRSLSPLAMTRSRQNVVLVLPVASATGEYALKVLDSNLEPIMTSKPIATLVDGVTSISTELDLTRVAPGRYTLALKKDPEDWRYFPLQVQ